VILAIGNKVNSSEDVLKLVELEPSFQKSLKNKKNVKKLFKKAQLSRKSKNLAKMLKKISFIKKEGIQSIKEKFRSPQKNEP